MNEDPDLLASAWHDAAADLGIEVRAPFHLSEGQEPCIAWVSGFGSRQGTIVVGRRTAGEGVRALAGDRGIHCSEIDEEAYGNYDRDLFIATLNDWGWHGDPKMIPDWYTGKAWG